MSATETPPTLFLGIATGLAAAAASAVSYLVARHHGARTGGAGLRLLVPAHALMGAVCLPVAWLLWPAALPPAANWLPPLLQSTICYLVGQACVYAALRRMPASRLAPLLGLKIVMLAAIVSCLPGDRLDVRQWAAVALAVFAAWLMRREPANAAAGSAPAPRGLAIVLVGCLFFALSDLGIVALIEALHAPCAACCPPIGRLHAGALAMAVTYVLCGAGALPFVPRLGLRGGDWVAPAQYAAAWLGSMVALYACFGTVGVVFGNILQSTRGIMAVLAGVALAHAGWHDLEERVDRVTLARRFGAAALMTAAIALSALDAT
ncbi:MAG: EamA family transporter [Planctomycetaceae bacterium]